MIVDREVTIDAPADEVFARVIDIPFVGECLPGARDVETDPAEPDRYRGRFAVTVGPVRVGLQGSVTVAGADAEQRRAVLMLRGSERRIGGDVVGEMRLGVHEAEGARSVLTVHTELTVSGKLGQFGQAVMIKKADQITEKFVAEFSRRLVASDGPRAVVGAPARAAAAAPRPAQLATGQAPTDQGTNGSAVVAAPVRSGDPYVLSALLRGGRRFWLDRGGGCPAAGSPGWQVGTVSATPGPARVVELAAADEPELKASLETIPVSTLVAVRARGAAVGDSDVLAAIVRGALDTGRAAIPVARAPWTALAAGRVALAEGAPGVAVMFETADDVSALLQLAVAEIREAGLHLPIVAGVVPEGRAARRLLAAGADGVVVTPGAGERVRGGWIRLLRRG